MSGVGCRACFRVGLPTCCLVFEKKDFSSLKTTSRILVFGSDQVLTELVFVALSGLDAEVRVVSDRIAFERITGRMVFDLVLLLDLEPLLSGRNFFRRLRPRPLHRPEIYLLAHHQRAETVLAMLECGIDQYLTIPLNLSRLRGKVIAALGR